MVLVTLGTQKENFSRLIDMIDKSNLDDEIIVQAGYTKVTSDKMKAFDFIPYEEMQKLIDDARLIITHGGTGSILMPLKKGKKIIACPRLAKYGEHVDDHQEQITSIFSEEGYILTLNDGDDLNILLNDIKTFKPKKYVSNTDNFIEAIKREIDG